MAGLQGKAARAANDGEMASQKIRVTSDLRARDVPQGTRVTPRGREYMLLGLAGGWLAGGVCMYLTWDLTSPVLSALKVLGAATAGSLVGTMVSWVMPGTRARMRVIREMKVHIEEERKAEARAVRVKMGLPSEDEPLVHGTSAYETAELEAPPPVTDFVASAHDEPAVNAVSPTGAVATTAEAPKSRLPRRKGQAVPLPEGDTSALVDAIGQYTTLDPDTPRQP